MRPNGVEKQVRPSGWKPWANTWCYLPLTSNLTDASWKWNSWSNEYWPTISYVSNWYINVVQVSGYWIKMPNLTVNNWSWTTISLWMKAQAHWIYMCFFSLDTANDDSHQIIRYQQYNNYNNTCYIGLWAWGVSTIQQTADFDSRHHYCAVFSGGTLKIYIDGNLYASSSISWTRTSTYHTLAADRTGYNYWTKQVSNYIIETKARTAQEITNYYNQTKWNYGL